MGAIEQGGRRLGRYVRGHLGLVGTGVAAATAAVIAAVGRRDRARTVPLPDPGPVAAETAISVHNAAKGAVLASMDAEVGGVEEVLAAVRAAVTGGAGAGADVSAAAIGAVEGAAQVARRMGQRPDELGARAALVAVEAACLQGEVAGDRARRLLAPYLA